jgi:Calcineurin-like phosphoesterase
MKKLFGKQLVKVFSLLVFTTLITSTYSFSNSSTNKNDLPSGEIAPEEVRFVAVGDAGTGGKEQYEVARQMGKIRELSRFDLVLFLGDNIYKSGSPGDFEKKFLKPYQGLIENGVELRACLGNHDVRNEWGVLLQKMIFGMGKNTYYSFNRKNNLIEFFALDSTILVKKEKELERNLQLAWFEKSLENSKARWKVVFLHHPLYSSAKRHGLDSGDEDQMFNVRELIEPILIKYKVNLVLNGHDHVYEHPQPQAGIHYFISGTGGQLRKGNLDKNTPFFGFGNDEVNSFILFSVKPEAAEFWAIDAQGNILENGKISNK